MQQKQIYFKSDFKVILGSETGWSVPFRLKFWTNAPSNAFVATFDGTTYTNCHLEADGRLCIAFDNHKLGLGTLMLEPTFFLNDQCYQDNVCDEVIPAFAVVVTEPATQSTPKKDYNIVLSLQGASTLETTGTLPAYYQKGDTGATGATGATGPAGPAGQNGRDGRDGVDGRDGQDGKDGGILYPTFNINQSGHLIATAPTTEAEMDITLNNQGHLILTI